MQVRTAKTTLVFTPGFLRNLKRMAREQRKSMSRIVEDELNPVFQHREKRKLSKMFAAIRKWQGSGSPGITDISQTIDETLYGASGVWKGSRAE
ncbi:MAG: hypothetical protein HND48_09425 [Chloroflexi bacterium]|nr:hypothetical protein [Chloroflexota bacterium]